MHSCFIVSGETLGCVQRRTAVKSSVTGALRVATFSTQETSPRKRKREKERGREMKREMKMKRDKNEKREERKRR